MNDILAKSTPQITLKEHIADCLKIHSYLKNQFSNISLIKGIPVEFWDYVALCIIFHDLGKSHSEFQKVLCGKSNKWDFQRHELFSVPFLLAYDEIPNNELKKYLILVVAGHHKDFNKLFSRYINNFYNDQILVNKFQLDLGSTPIREFKTEFQKVDIKSILNILKDEYNIKIKIENINNFDLSFIREYNNKGIDIAHKDYLFLILLFGALKNCDHLGSAQIKEIQNISKEDFSFLDAQKNKLLKKGVDFYQHQKDASQTIGNAILTAPTGTGKTESAFLWLKNHYLKDYTGQVFYILPFTASINAMFERLNDVIDGQKVGMVHGKLSAYLNDYFEEHQFSQSTKKEAINELKSKFKNVTTPIKICTPFQLLKHIFGLKGFEKGLFEWSNAFFIFDEIHAYDTTTFAQIIVLMEFANQYLNAKFFVMTATLPFFLRSYIEAAINPAKSINANQKLYQDFQRHKLFLLEGLLEENLDLIIKDLQLGKKVLVVCNRVDQAQDIYKILKNHCKNAVLLHGRFNNSDRNLNEQKLLSSENSEISISSISLLVGTQAIEVSLDIDFEVIYTEPAPIDALLQRFGRINRQRKRGVSPCYVFKESNKKDFYIYDKSVIERTLDIFNKSNSSIIDESILQSYIDEVYPSWSEKQKKDFDFIYENMHAMIKTLIPLTHSKKTEEDFYKNFDGAKVLPLSLKAKFENLILDFDFISAENLKVGITNSRFKQWINEGFVIKQKYMYEKSTKNDLVQIEYFLTNKKYDHELGLMSNEHTPWSPDNFM